MSCYKAVLGGPFGAHKGALEVELDIELQIAMSPGLKKLLVYNAPNTELGILTEYKQIAQDNQADTVSSSWGIPCEYSVTTEIAQTENQFFFQMATQGQSTFIASGDAGAYGCSEALFVPPPSSVLQVGDPGNQPYVTAVGGTQFRTHKGAITFDPGKNQHPTYPGKAKEVAWANHPCTPSSYVSSGGGLCL